MIDLKQLKAWAIELRENDFAPPMPAVGQIWCDETDGSLYYLTSQEADMFVSVCFNWPNASVLYEEWLCDYLYIPTSVEEVLAQVKERPLTCTHFLPDAYACVNNAGLRCSSAMELAVKEFIFTRNQVEF